MSSPVRHRDSWIWGGVTAGAFGLLLLLEIVTEDEPLSFLDILSDGLALLLTAVTAAGLAILFQRVHRQQEKQERLVQRIDQAHAERDAWRRRAETHVNGLRAAIDEQFAIWGLTPAERTVGLLLLKGLSHKEIALQRATSEATVRQQAQAIYEKAGVAGKAAFTAYFLDDLLNHVPAHEAHG